MRDINFMLDTKLSIYWRVCWFLVCPLLLPLLFFYVLFTQSGVPHIPVAAQLAGWVLAAVGASLVPLHWLLSITGDEEGEFLARVWATLKNGALVERTRDALHPNNNWGPARIKEKTEWQIYCEDYDVHQWLPKFIR